MDWLGIQSAIAHANATVSNGHALVFIPGGRQYWISRDLVNANGNYSGVHIYGHAFIEATADFGLDANMLTEVDRTRSNSSYQDLVLNGPNATLTTGVAPNQMNILSVGAGANVRNVTGQLGKYGAVGCGDHITFENNKFSNNWKGLYAGPFGTTFGNWVFNNNDLVGNTQTSVGISATNQIDSSTFFGGHTGGCPNGFEGDVTPPNVTSGAKGGFSTACCSEYQVRVSVTAGSVSRALRR